MPSRPRAGGGRWVAGGPGRTDAGPVAQWHTRCLGAHAGAEDAGATRTLAAELRIQGAEAVEFIVATDLREELVRLQADERLLLFGDLLFATLSGSLRIGTQAGDLALGLGNGRLVGGVQLGADAVLVNTGSGFKPARTSTGWGSWEADRRRG